MGNGTVRVAIAAALLLVAYFAWRFLVRGDALVLATKSPGKQVSARVKRLVPDREIVLEISDAGPKARISEISMSRALAKELEASAPAGFREEALPLTEKEKGDRDALEFAEKFNRETVRWVGALPLSPGAPVELVLPAARARQCEGSIDLEYREKYFLGGKIALVRVPLSSGAPGGTP